MEKYKNIYRIPSARLKGWDYGSDGLYFVTLCTWQRECCLGKIIEENQNKVFDESQIGQIARENWIKIPDHFPFVELDEFVIMPDHIHGVLIFNKIKTPIAGSPIVETQNIASLPEKKQNEQKWIVNRFGPQSQNLASVIRGFKASVKTFARKNKIEFEWQARYYDRIIRDENELNRIRIYIRENISKWDEQNDHVKNFEKLNI